MSGKRIAAVTGASRGIGRATALHLAREGYRVFALARSLDDLATLAAESPNLIHPVPLDVADDTSRQTAVRAIMQATSNYGVDLLVNNAGYAQLGPMEEVSVEKFRQQLEVNVVGVLGFTQPFLPVMREREHGTIVNVSSIAGRMSTPFMGAYSASKFALEAISDALRLELAPFGIRVVIVSPGPIVTNFGDAARAVSEESSASPYAPFTRRWRGARKGSDLFQRSPEHIARIIAGAAAGSSPRIRYTVTLPAKLGAVARRLVPDTVTDWTLRRAMGLRRTR